jgi:hypothetical protein
MENKPLIVEIEESKNELIQCVNHIINDKGIPCYFVESMMAGIFEQVKIGAKNELIIAMKQVKAESPNAEV